MSDTFWVNSLPFWATHIRGTIVKLISETKLDNADNVPNVPKALSEDRRIEGEKRRRNCAIHHSRGQRTKNSTNVTAETLHQHQAEVNGTMSCGECTMIKRGENIMASYRRHNIKLARGCGDAKAEKKSEGWESPRWTDPVTSVTMQFLSGPILQWYDHTKFNRLYIKWLTVINIINWISCMNCLTQMSNPMIFKILSCQILISSAHCV